MDSRSYERIIIFVEYRGWSEDRPDIICASGMEQNLEVKSFMSPCKVHHELSAKGVLGDGESEVRRRVQTEKIRFELCRHF